jgi:hypothetical protein
MFTYDRQSSFSTFDCDHPGCIKRFFRYKNLVDHHARADHVYKPDKVRLRDKAIQLFKNGVEAVKPNQIHQLHNFTVISNTSNSTSDDEQSTSSDDEVESTNYILQHGWAL